MTKEDFTLGMKSERMTDLALAFKQTGTILAAIEMDLFTHIANGAGTVDEIAAAMGIDVEKADRLLTACKSMHLVREVDGQQKNFSDVQRYLVKDSRTYFGDYLEYMAHRDYRAWEHIAQNLTAEAETNEDDDRTYVSLMQDPKRARDFTEAGYEASIGLGHKLAKEFDFSQFKRWLDLGGGSGCYAIAACERQQGFTVTVLDQPNVIAVAEEFIAKHELGTRIDTTPGDFFGASYPKGYDLATYITPLQGYMPDKVVAALAKAKASLEPGGMILVIDYMLKDDKTGPLDPAFVNLFGIRDGRYLGRVNTGVEWCDFMEEAGYVDAEYRWFTPHQLGLITARNPL
ncbi:MAG: methyltransferase [Pseudomonadota bacterium]|nr:methyltransferase [Pseudomonadota bacterium]